LVGFFSYDISVKLSPHPFNADATFSPRSGPVQQDAGRRDLTLSQSQSFR
jgi:hypothetical protein